MDRTDDEKKYSDRNNSGNGRPKRRRHTRSYRHVSLEHKRPELSRDIKKKDSARFKASGRRGDYSDFTARRDPASKLEIIPLGGLDAIGKNMCAFSCNGDMILDDAGLMFPDDNHPGIDLVLPDYTYVLENADHLRGIFITHGHEDHTGALPYLMKDLDRDIPIYATKMTLGLIEGKFAEHKIKNAKLVETNPGDTVSMGCFRVSFFSVNHSIPGAVGAFISSPAGNVLHTGDFKLDQTPIDGVRTDFAAIARFGDAGVDLLMSDSTNAKVESFTPSEAEVGKVLRQIIAGAKGKVLISSFSSHIHRMQQICDAAVSCGRKVVVTGRSMIQNTDIARRLGYLNIDDDDLIDAYYLQEMPANKVVVMCTGSQGEPLSALYRIAEGRHKTIDIEAQDTVIISATPVPGNEKAVTRVINLLAKIGADVYDRNRAPVHVSGHAAAEELKIMLCMSHPRAFLPVHGEASHLRAHAQLAQSVGVDPKNIFILDNGDTLFLDSSGIRQGESVQSGIIFVDGLSVGDTSQEVLDERSSLSDKGFVSVAAALDLHRRKIRDEIRVEMHGIAGGDDEGLCNSVRDAVISTIRGQMNRPNVSAESIESAVKSTISNIMWEKTNQRPMAVVNVLKV